MEAACAHTKIKEVRWNEDHGQSSKFMCLDCNTDFVPLTSEIRDYLFRKGQASVTMEDPPDVSWVETVDIRKDNYDHENQLDPGPRNQTPYNKKMAERSLSRALHGVDCSCSKC